MEQTPDVRNLVTRYEKCLQTVSAMRSRVAHPALALRLVGAIGNRHFEKLYTEAYFWHECEG